MTEIAVRCHDIVFLAMDDYLWFRAQLHPKHRPQDRHSLGPRQLRSGNRIFFFLIDFKTLLSTFEHGIFPKRLKNVVVLNCWGFIEVGNERQGTTVWSCSSRYLLPGGVDTDGSVALGPECPLSMVPGKRSGCGCVSLPHWAQMMFSMGVPQEMINLSTFGTFIVSCAFSPQ